MVDYRDLRTVKQIADVTSGINAFTAPFTAEALT